MRYIFGQELQRDEATKLGVLSLIDDTHPAAAQFLDDAVVGDGLPNELGDCAHWRKCYAAIVSRSIGTRTAAQVRKKVALHCFLELAS